MKKLSFLVLIFIAILFTTVSCQKDENGNRITYYKNKTGEGYVFFKFIIKVVMLIKNLANIII